MKVLVTGGAGFIGSHIVDLLIKNNYEVCIIDDLSHGNIDNINSKAKFYKYNIKSSNLINIFKIEKPEVIIHEAAKISVSDSIKYPIKDAETNIIGTLNVLEAARKTNIKKIIYSSSSAVFGKAEYFPIDENHPLNTISNYGVSKQASENYLKVYKELYGLNYIILRYSNVYGPRQKSSGESGVIPIFCMKILKDKSPFIYGDGNQTRDFIYVKDVARANLLSIQNNLSGIFNVSSNKSISINQLFKYISSILNKNISPIYKRKINGDIENSLISYKKIFNELGWKPKYTILEGLKETIEFYKKR
ncbi:UDP-glucose 4-epimerase [Clostridium algifaecis]|uniref:UDP-glucose 4-epimerase n=1 Tax=Clostridium algifaecis TaxID=1472040 RepID=A0ABS4KRN4_9CLOT|nr:NAD-dependent epimerase/dehydratase family protein [Clostridium algifaecis]MBP2031539.1 UDP-glucose 4-epimerase [Clostridium algifaecis]